MNKDRVGSYRTPLPDPSKTRPVRGGRSVRSCDVIIGVVNFVKVNSEDRTESPDIRVVGTQGKS